MVIRTMIAVANRGMVDMIKDIMKNSSYHYKIEYVEQSVAEVLSKADTYNTDLAFLDIDLPGGGGIYAMLQIKKMYPNAKVVIISSMDSYDMVRQAFSQGADDYLLLNASYDTVDRTVSRLRKRIIEEKGSDEIRKNDEIRNSILEKLAKNSIVYAILFHGKMDSRVVNVYRQVFDFDIKAFIINIEFEKTLETDAPGKHPLIIRTLEGVMGRSGEKYLLGPYVLNRIMIIVSGQFSGKSETNRRMRELAQNVKKELEKAVHCRVFAGIGDVYKIENIYLSYAEAIKALRYRDDNNDVVLFGDVSPNDKLLDYKEFNQLVRETSEKIKSNPDEALTSFGKILRKLEGINPATRKNKIIEIMVYLNQCVNNMGPSEFDFMNVMDMCGSIEKMSDDDVDSWAINRLYHLIKSAGDIEEDKSSKPVQMAKQYIKDNYTEAVSLSDAAEHIGISPQYLSKIFKDETGYNFVEWVNMFKIEKAKELLDKKEMNISEVGYKMGFINANYFSRAFKKYIGVSPSTYMKKSAEKKNDLKVEKTDDKH